MNNVLVRKCLSLGVCYPGEDPVKTEADCTVKAMKDVRTFIREKLKGI